MKVQSLSGRSPGGAQGNPLQYSCQEDPMKRGASWATVRGVAKSQTWLSMHAHAFSPHSQTASLTESIFSQCELVITFLHFTRNYIKISQNLFFSVQFSCSVMSDSVTPWTTTGQASLSITNSWSLPKLMSIGSVMPSNHQILCHPLLLLPSVFPSIRVFSNESVLCIRWPNYWSFSFSLSNEYSGLIFFRIDWLDLLAVQGTLKSLLHYHSSKALILWCLAFFIVQLSQPYMTMGKTSHMYIYPLKKFKKTQSSLNQNWTIKSSNF